MISIGILTFPPRIKLAKSLKDKISSQTNSIEIYNDHQCKGVWWNARRAWLDLSKKGTEYCMLLQEDVLLCEDFIPSIQRLLQHNLPPFFTPYNRFPHTKSIKDTWRIAKYPTNGVCNILQTSLIFPFISWSDRNFKSSFWSDDARLYTFLLENNIPARVVIPGLCQHMWWLESSEKKKHGILKAENFIGESCSGLSLDLSSGYHTLLDDKYGVPLSTWNPYRIH